MLVHPYHTTICSMYRLDHLVRGLQRADIESSFPSVETPAGNTVRDARLVPPNDNYTQVSGFTQCVNIGLAKQPKWVIDARPYMRWDRRHDSYRLLAENDFSFQCTRLALTQVAEGEGERPFLRLGDVPIKTFVRWVTLGVSQRFNLSLEDQMRLSVIVAYYYYTQLTPTREQSETDRHRLANQVSRIVSIPTPQILEIIEPVGALTDGAALASAIAEHGGSVRLSNIKFSDLFLLLASSWVGVNSRENVGVALEHIPTFIAMVYLGLGDRSYRKTLITRRAETAGRQIDHKQFLDQTYRLVESRFA